METNQRIINHVKNELSKAFSIKDGYTIETDVAWGRTSSRLSFDLVVRKDKVLYILFDIISYQITEFEEVVFPVTWLKSTGAKFYIRYMSNYEKYLLFEKDYIHSKDNYSDYIADRNEFCSSFNSIDGVINILKSAIKGYPQIPLDKETSCPPDNKSVKYYDSSTIELDPEWCREQLPVLRDASICRYSSLDSVFSMLKYKTMRLNGLPGMNDRDEGLFAWRLITGEKISENKEIKRREGLLNNAFIVSFSRKAKIDDLTQWRLYGDDAKGVCCVYSIQKEMVKDRFFIHPISYIKKDSNKQYILDELLRLFKEESHHRSDLDFPDFSPAIFFYKPCDFESEDEIRFLVDNKKGAYKTTDYKREWVLTKSNNIPNPYIDIPLDEVPLKLERIILGSAMKDVDTIQAQLETMLSQQGIQATVELSKIISYRNPDNK